MSNLGEFGAAAAKLSAGEKESLDALGSFIGLAADISGAVGLGTLIVGVVSSLIGSDKDVLAPLTKEVDLIRNELERFIVQVGVDALLMRVQTLDLVVAPTQTALQQLISELPPNPPPTPAEVRAEIGSCLTPLNGLNTDTQWEANFLSQLYYDDGGAWAGRKTPPTRADGAPNEQFFVFSTRYVMIRFARSLAHLVAVGLTLDPRFLDNHRMDLAGYVGRLEDSWQKSVDGIIVLPAPTHGQLLEVTQDADGNDAYVQLMGFCDGIWARGKNSLPGSIGFNQDWFQMYGAFDLYGAYFAVGNYPGVLPPDSPPVNRQPPADFLARFDATHTLRSIAARKIVYRELGLVALRSILAKVKSITGVGTLPDFDPESWWSLREINGILAPAFGGPPNPGVRTTIAWLNALSGASAASLRAALEALVLPIALTGAPQPPPGDGG